MKGPRSSTIRASEIGTYLFCRRAWWYQERGQESENQAELISGTRIHEQHGRSVFVAGLFRSAGYLVLLLALILAMITLLTQLL